VSSFDFVLSNAEAYLCYHSIECLLVWFSYF